MSAATLRVPLLGWGCFDSALVRTALTTRAGGASIGPFESLNMAFHVGDDDAAVLTNRERCAEAFGTPLHQFVFAQQVAGAQVTTVSAADRGRGAVSHDTAIPETDALITSDPGVVLAVLSADCVPIVLHDPANSVLAVVHAGWRGITAGVTLAAVAAMTNHGADPAKIIAGIGPAVDGKLYRVGDDVADAARDAFGNQAPAVLGPDGSGRYLFDLVAAARLQLVAAGLSPSNIEWCGHVTGPSTPFFSHRFEGPTGRFATMAQLVEAGP